MLAPEVGRRVLWPDAGSGGEGCQKPILSTGYWQLGGYVVHLLRVLRAESRGS